MTDPDTISDIRAGTVEFNINSYVFVQLTSAGLLQLRRIHDGLNARTNGALGKFKAPDHDADGWSRHQLWSLMQDFGPVIRMGGEVPFSTTIRFETGEVDRLRTLLREAAGALEDATAELFEAQDKFWVIHCNHPGEVCGPRQAEDKAFLAKMADRMGSARDRARDTLNHIQGDIDG